MTDPTAQLRELMPYSALLGMIVDQQSPDQVVMSMDWTPERTTVGGLMHGGAVMSLADSAGALCAFLNLPEGSAGTTTIESKSNLLGAVRNGRVVATSRPLHVGRTTIVIETETRRDDGKLVAKTTQTQAVLTA